MSTHTPKAGSFPPVVQENVLTFNYNLQVAFDSCCSCCSAGNVCVLAVDIATAVGLLIITANTLPDTVQQASAFWCVIFAINFYILNFYVIPSFFCFSNLGNLLFILYVVNCK